MGNKWIPISFSDAVDLNPTVKLLRNSKSPFVDMKSIDSTRREVSYGEMRVFTGGGAKFLPNDILMARITPCLENGKIARYTPTDKTCAAFGSTEFIVIRGKEDVTDGEFACYLTMWQEFRKFAISQMTGSSGRQRVPINSLVGFTFSLPPLPEQRAIARILGSFDDKIELNRRMNETLEAMAQAMFKSWFVDFDPVIDNALAARNKIPDELKEKANARKALGDARKPLPKEIQKLFPSEFEHNKELGWIPKGWEVSTVGEEFNITMGQSPPGSTYNKTGEGIPFFQGCSDFGFRYPSDQVYCTAPKRFAEQHDTLVSVRAPVGNINMALNKCSIGRGVSAIRHKSSSRSYTYYSMLHLGEHFKTFEAEGTVFGSINQNDFKALKWLKGNPFLVEKYESLAGQFDERIEISSRNILALSTLRDTLLPKLLSGEIRVSQMKKLMEEAYE